MRGSVARRVHLSNLFFAIMNPAREAIHSIRNDLTPILWYAQLAGNGDREAQELVIKELVSRSDAIHAELDLLTSEIRKHQKQASGKAT
jgi:hypothetical protein